jgi:hypothetical protein
LTTGDAFQINAAIATGKAGAATSCANGFVEIDTNVHCDGILTPANGGAIAGIIQSNMKPFSIRHHATTANNAATGLAGFSIDAQQVPC